MNASTSSQSILVADLQIDKMVYHDLKRNNTFDLDRCVNLTDEYTLVRIKIIAMKKWLPVDDSTLRQLDLNLGTS